MRDARAPRLLGLARADLARWGSACAALAVAVTILSSGQAAAEAGSRERFWAGSWSGWAYTDGNGRFRHCGISKLYPNGMRLVFSLSDERAFNLSLMNPDWRLETGERYDLTLSIDVFWRREMAAKAAQEQLLLIPLPYEKELVEILRRSSTLTIHDGQSPHDFELTGTSAAFKRLEACVEKRAKS